MSAAPVRIVERYLFDLYNAQNVDLVHELCGDPLIRHAAGTVTTMTRSEQVDRIAADLAAHNPKFEIVSLFGDQQYASLTWNAERLTTGERLCGIEIFKTEAGFITDVWNSGYFEGSWS